MDPKLTNQKQKQKQKQKQTYNTYNKSEIARAIELLRTTCSMHDVTNQAKKHHERFAKEKTELLR